MDNDASDSLPLMGHHPQMNRPKTQGSEVSDRARL
jgi:hypothetical protein